MKRNNEEHQIQVGLFEWIDLQKEIYPALKNAFAIPNGGSRNEIEAANLKAEGVKAGVLDVCLAYPSNGFHGLFIEHKTKKGKLSKDKPIYHKSKYRGNKVIRYIREGQETWFERLVEAGYCCRVSRSVYESIDILKIYLGIG